MKEYFVYCLMFFYLFIVHLVLAHDQIGCMQPQVYLSLDVSFYSHDGISDKINKIGFHKPHSAQQELNNRNVEMQWFSFSEFFYI